MLILKNISETMDTIPVRQVGIKSLGIREICAHVTAPALKDVGLALEGSRIDRNFVTHDTPIPNLCRWHQFADVTNLPQSA